MADPFVPHLLFGIVTNSFSNVVVNATLNVKTSLGERVYNTDSLGMYSLDLADIGYTDGETITIRTREPFNNELKDHPYTVTGGFSQQDITLALRTRVENISNLNEQNVLHSVGKKPITADNPLSIVEKWYRIQFFYTKTLAKQVSGPQTEFIGWAKPGSSKADAVWIIQKLSFEGTFVTDLQWADGNTNEDNIWNARKFLSYS